ncbi:unannotated protein [freshwater metagenome]|uniref:Unannotated protein n=1 Tax=freshwater metagenome TaxID=449393 RepID=A0A6J7MNG1_9ZZZZ
MIWTSGSTTGEVVVVVELAAAALNRVVGGVVVVVAVAIWAFAINCASSLKPEPSAMRRELSIGASTHRHPEPGSAGSMIANSRPTAVEIVTEGST